MKIIQNAQLVSVTLLMSACISFPQSIDEFLDQSPGFLEFEVDLPLQEAYELAAHNTIRCHQGDSSQMSMVGSSFVVFPTGQTRVEGVVDEGGQQATMTVRYFNPTASGLLQVIDFYALSESASRITVHKLNDTKKWRTATQAVEKWFQGSRECYKML